MMGLLRSAVWARRCGVWALVSILMSPAWGDEIRASKPASAEGKKAVAELRDSLQAGIMIGLDEPMDRLKKLGEEEQGVPVLAMFLEKKNGRGLRSDAAAECLGKLGSVAVAATPALLGALKESDGFSRDAYVKAIIAINPPAEVVVPKLVELLESKDADLRGKAIHLLGGDGSECEGGAAAAGGSGGG